MKRSQHRSRLQAIALALPAVLRAARWLGHHPARRAAFGVRPERGQSLVLTTQKPVVRNADYERQNMKRLRQHSRLQASALALPAVLRATRWFGHHPAGRAAFGVRPACRHRRRLLQSQRDCVLQPRVARHELPWESGPSVHNPERVAANSLRGGRNPVGVGNHFRLFPPG